ncbi:malto-oligosyltrehalose synthase [Xaviernesmea oryzae]|uniref:Malto-oligosyltrehalose synthase n=1 Tax=Xaviernesmea oryzae TaxID=464029 RepID=A0A1Q9AZ98_9HYPH|nr:malto-oligosyltrehalose synthase [Xaviernesmea oryzae]OLP61028.1 malto-oligosyltrehalose synthase [Xaviernesmea oryzae]SEL16477.1 (1->4)-alpha-D-glucan 1-alpha-D-glucosylmutase [Xaviernesmea oryzae]
MTRPAFARPLATYRLQFRNGMTFDKAASLVPYIKNLGITHLYASPIFAATKGSTHGYDVTDANLFDPDLGGREGFDRLSAALSAAELGLIVDIVPNHMAASLENPWWRSIVEWGEESPHARTFDVDWAQPLTLTVLGGSFEEGVQKGEIGLAIDREAGVLGLSYYEQVFPLLPSTYKMALEGIDLPLARTLAECGSSARADEDEAFHAAIRQAIDADKEGMEALQTALKAVKPGSILALSQAQPYRLMDWKKAASGLSYRRFFEIAGLAGLRVEDEQVFEASHRLILDLVRKGIVHGLRIDHVDGLADPKAYLDRLRAAVGPDVPIVIEKIIEEEESVAEDWPVEGTTGYEFVAALAQLFTAKDGMTTLGAAYDRFAPGEAYDDILQDAKMLMLRENFEGEVKALTRIGKEAAGQADGAGTGSAEAFAGALRALVAGFSVYRTYGTDGPLNSADEKVLDAALAKAAGDLSVEERDALGDIEALLRGRRPGEKAALFRTRFQQLSGPVMAKAMEDTAFYRYNAFLALNEVGGNPVEPHPSIDAFHDAMVRRVSEQPEALSTTATHDTKRGEDARARLYALSQGPQRWIDAVGRWHATQAGSVKDLPGGKAPEPAVEWGLYQALAGAWPVGLKTDDAKGIEAFGERFAAYVEKTMREAKLRSFWAEPDEAYEGAVQDFVRQLLSSHTFLQDFAATLGPYALTGLYNGLAQTLVKLAASGVPDIYQGSETDDFSLVDPDNRRMPDFARLERLAQQPATIRLDLDSLESGAAKQALVRRGLAARQALPNLFLKGDYRPLSLSGDHAERFVAFARVYQGQAAIAVAPVRIHDLLEASGAQGLDTAAAEINVHLPEDLIGRTWHDRLGTDEAAVEADEILALSASAAAPFLLMTTEG